MPLEIYFEWLDSLVQSDVLEVSWEAIQLYSIDLRNFVPQVAKLEGHDLAEESRRFALSWCYFGELAARELTLHSAPSFGNVL